jgi:FMNH2-dependent dimethyl sulfone monooxygenase
VTVEIGALLPTIGSWFRELAPRDPRPSFRRVRSLATLAEDLSFDSLWVPDHLLNPPLGPGAGILESWVTLSALALDTERVQLGHTANCNGFRHPALVAKMGATLDELSGGRLVLAMGAGAYEPEFKVHGLAFEAHAERIRKAAEAVQIIRSLWTQETTTFKGRYYAIDGARLAPKPLQKPSPPIWIAGSSASTKSVAARLGDGWLTSGKTPEQLSEEFQSLLEVRDPGAGGMDLAVMVLIVVHRDGEGAYDLVQPVLERRRMSRADFSRRNVIGSPEECAVRLGSFLDAGVTHLILRFAPPRESMTLFGEEVLPDLKAR